MNKEQPIKGKEEIYKEAWAKWANETFITDPPLKKEDCDNEHSWIYGAMDEYAKQFHTPIAEGEERLLAEIERLKGLIASKDDILLEVEQIFNLPKCYKTSGICRYDCKGLCKDSC